MFDGINESQGYAGPFNDYSSRTVTPPHTTALMVWIVGAVCVVVFGLCSVATLALAILQPAEVMSQFPSEQIEALRIGLWLMPVCMSVFFILPGIALLVLGFGVRAGKRGSIVAAVSIVWTQAGLLGILLMLNLIGAGVSGDLLGLLINFVVFGAILALFVTTALKLHATRPGKPADHFDDPWNSHLTQ